MNAKRFSGNPLLCLAALLVVLAGLAVAERAAAQQAEPPAAPAEKHAHDDAYIIGPSDVLAINVWKEADLTRSLPVRSDGKVSLPLVGEVQAAGKTPAQLEADLTARLSGFITEPSVTVIVEQVKSKNFNILGQVSKPGTYSLTIAPTIIDAIAAAGGFREFAKQKGVYILRKKPDGTDTRISFNYKDFVRGKDLSKNVRLEAGDTIIVP